MNLSFKNNNFIVLISAVIFYLVYFILISVMRYNSFSFHDFDLAVHALSMWNILHGSIYNSILGIPFLGNHVHLILFLIAPVYAIFSHPLALLILQTLALGLGAIPLYKLAARVLGENWGLIVGIIYLFYPALGYTNLFEFHPTVFATLFLLLTCYYFELNSFPKFLFFMILSMLCQENIALAVIMFGFLSFINKKGPKWILTPFLAGISYFFISMSIMSYFNQNTVQFLNIYSHLGNSSGNILSNVFLHPGLFLKTIFRKECLFYLFNLFAPVSFLPLLSPLRLLPAMPFLLQHMLSTRQTELTIYYHYAAEIIPFIFISLIYGIKFFLDKEKNNLRPWLLKVSLIFVILISNLIYGPHFKAMPKLFSEYRMNYLDRYKEEFIRQIPQGASVVATFEFLPRLSSRKDVYSLHHKYMGFYTLSSKKYDLPDVDFALVDFNDTLTFAGFYRPDFYKNLQQLMIQEKWKVQSLMESVVLFNKNGPSDTALFNVAREPFFITAPGRVVSIEQGVALVGVDVKERNEDNLFDITLYWQSLKQTPRDINIFLDFLDSKGNLVARKFHPVCYRIYPTRAWQAGEFIKERVRIDTEGISSKGSCLKMGFFDYQTGELLKVSGEVDVMGRLTIMEKK
ncbi:MAG: DUF2079 domain-containing protein [Candidatus Omnitrophica bacterium]|nr:DUF2079 domain-containing protein [Candidatus Omnitrophota bacterium]